MSESTYRKDQRHPGDPQVTGGGGHEPDPTRSAGTGGLGGQEERRGTPGPDAPTPSGGAGYDLKSSELPEPKSDSGV